MNGAHTKLQQVGLQVARWRWPLVLGLPLIAGGVLVSRGTVRLNYEGRALLSFSGNAQHMEDDIALFRPHAPRGVAYEKNPGHPHELLLYTQGAKPDEIVSRLITTGQTFLGVALTERKRELLKQTEGVQVQKVDQEARFNELVENRASLLTGTKPRSPRADLVAKVEALKARRRLLIERYPTHSDIPLLAKQIQDLVHQMGRPVGPKAEKINALDRQITEAKVRLDYFSRRFQQITQNAQALKPEWKIIQPVQKPTRPIQLVGWRIVAGLLAASFILGLILSRIAKPARGASSVDGLWRPEPAVAETPVALEVVSPEPTTAVAAAAQADVPMDALTEKASLLYGKWVDIAKALYEPAPQAPQGVLDQVAPLLDESNEFLAEGHEVLTKYLARCVTSGDLAAHVARTVLMTLTGAREAGVSPEHCLAMALAALFHDLAVVPRPSGLQEDVGSEVGRLSASVLPRIPGLPAALLTMVEDILVGMDEFKLETWQNAANSSTLEPLSKVLREIDRFEKVMQKQKSRLDRRLANQ